MSTFQYQLFHTFIDTKQLVFLNCCLATWCYHKFYLSLIKSSDKFKNGWQGKKEGKTKYNDFNIFGIKRAFLVK